MVLLYTALLLLIAGCSNIETAKEESCTEGAVSSLADIPVINRDSLLDYLAIRYDHLTEERRRAYATNDSTLRAQRLMLNDKHCADFADSLRFVVGVSEQPR